MAFDLGGLARQVAGLVRRGAFDTSTDAGRSRERYRRVGLTFLATVAGRGAAAVASLIAVPVMLRYLGAERYGLWAAISSAGMAAKVGLGVAVAVGEAMSSAVTKGGVAVAVWTLPGVGVGVPVVIATAQTYSAVAWLPGVGVTVTTAGVTQFSGKGVAVPTRSASARISSPLRVSATRSASRGRERCTSMTWMT